MTEYEMYIDGQWCGAQSGEFYDAINPAQGEPFGKIPKGGREDAQRAITAANEASETWRKVPLWERSAMCVKIAEVLDRRKDEIADILCTELGKPRHQEATFEAGDTSTPWRVAAEQAKYFEAHTKPCQDPTKRVLTFWPPRGVVTVITPWNFPAAIPGEYLPFSIVMGNTVCWTPAPTAAATAIKLAECIHEAGLPKGVINLVTDPGAEVGDEFVVNRGTHAVGMTGSPQTAHTITTRAGLKPRLFELGGNGPVVILPDANPQKIAGAVASACFFAAGQVCSCAERIFVADNLKKEFVDATVAETAKWKVGDPWDESTTMGPQNNLGVVEKTGHHLKDAVTKGATVVAGGKRPDRPGFSGSRPSLPISMSIHWSTRKRLSARLLRSTRFAATKKRGRLSRRATWASRPQCSPRTLTRPGNEPRNSTRASPSSTTGRTSGSTTCHSEAWLATTAVWGGSAAGTPPISSAISRR